MAWDINFAVRALSYPMNRAHYCTFLFINPASVRGTSKIYRLELPAAALLHCVHFYPHHEILCLPWSKFKETQGYGYQAISVVLVGCLTWNCCKSRCIAMVNTPLTRFPHFCGCLQYISSQICLNTCEQKCWLVLHCDFGFIAHLECYFRSWKGIEFPL
jgi:hypothetical protein